MTSPQSWARVAGLFYLVIIACGLYAEAYVRGSLIGADPATTAHNILASETLYRSGALADLISQLCDVVVAVALYIVLKPVNRNLALLAAFFRLAAVAILSAATLFHLAPLILLKGTYLTGFTQPQLAQLSFAALKLHTLGYLFELMFFGVHCVLIGYLVLRSTFLPRILGVLLAISGVCYVTDFAANILVPAFGNQLFPWILLPGFVSELAFALWLTIRGVNAVKWKEAAAV